MAETLSPLAQKLQHKKDFLSSFKFGKHALSEDEVQKVTDSTPGWESARDEFEKRKATFQLWKDQPMTFWGLPFQHNVRNGCDLIVDCYRAINFGKDDNYRHRQRCCMEIVQMAVIDMVGDEMSELGETLRAVAHKISMYQPDKRFDQVVKKVSEYRKKGEKLLSLGLGMHLVLNTTEYSWPFNLSVMS